MICWAFEHCDRSASIQGEGAMRGSLPYGTEVQVCTSFMLNWISPENALTLYPSRTIVNREFVHQNAGFIPLSLSRFPMMKRSAVLAASLTLSACSAVPSQDSVQSFVYGLFHGWQQNRCVRSAGDTSPQGPCYKAVADYEDYKKARESLNRDPDKCVEKAAGPLSAPTCPQNGSTGGFSAQR
jgi:hypothetical protein